MPVFLSQRGSWLRISSHAWHMFGWWLAVLLGGVWSAGQCMQNRACTSQDKQQQSWVCCRLVSVHAQWTYSVSAYIHIFILQRSFQQLILTMPLTLWATRFSDFQRQESHIPYRLQMFIDLKLNSSGFKDFIWSLLSPKFNLECIFTENTPLDIHLVISMVIKMI